MYVLPINDSQTIFNGYVDKSAKKYIKSASASVGTDTFQAESVIGKLENFMGKFHKDTALKIRKPANVQSNSAVPDIIFVNRNLPGDVYLSADELLLNADKKAENCAEETNFLGRIAEMLKANNIDLNIDKKLFDKFRTQMQKDVQDISVFGQIKALYRANRAKHYAKSISNENNIVEDVQRDIGEALYQDIKTKSSSKQKLPVHKRSKDV